MFEAGEYEVLAVDHGIPLVTGLEMIHRLLDKGPLSPTIMITEAGNEAVAVAALKLGEYDYITKDAGAAYLDLVAPSVDRALEKKHLLESKLLADGALRKSEEKYRRIVETAGDGIWQIDEDGRTVFANIQLAEMFGISVAKMTGGSIRDFGDEDWRETKVRDLQPLRVPSKQRQLYKLAREDRSDLWGTLGTVSIWDAAGEFRGWLGMLTDVTEQRQNEERLRQADRYRAVADLASGVAHSFGNLLQVIAGNTNIAEMNLQAGDMAALKVSLTEIVETNRLASAVTNRLKTFASPAGTTEGPATSIVNLSEIAREATERAGPSAKAAPDGDQAEIVYHWQLEDECLVRGKPTALAEAVACIVKNAVEALPEGGDFKISTAIQDNTVVLRVRNTGIGIGEDDLRRPFDPFFTTKFQAGRGMGLPTARSIIEGIGGLIFVESAVGKWTKVTVCPPLWKTSPKRTVQSSLA